MCASLRHADACVPPHAHPLILRSFLFTPISNRGLILNLGSFSGQFPVPLLTTYAGTKTFLIGYSQALGEELRRSKVVVQNLNTYFVVSNLSGIRRSSFVIPTAKQYVGSVLGKIGRQGGAVGRPYNMTPYPAHALIDWLVTSTISGTHMLLRFNYGAWHVDPVGAQHTNNTISAC